MKDSDTYAEFGHFLFEFSRSQLTVHGRVVNLPPSERILLTILVSRLNQVVRRDDVMRLMGGSLLDVRAVDRTVCRLRRSLAAAKGAHILETVRNVGYVLRP
ncbi:winged helix-turn-helix domain-containing protein [Stenotrophomonas maltophilia]|uniref:winged helix-turn-helix domain-containing protein n=1 Tax=Stenotrophomonas maltophilia TaxID=40324 RepID=UPI003BF9181F